MAQKVDIQGSSGSAKIRSHVWVGIWSLVTLVIYPWYWYYQINRELRDLGRARNAPQLGERPLLSLLAVTFGALALLIPSMISVYRTGARIRNAQRLAGLPNIMNGWMAFILFGIFDFYYILLPVPGPLCSAYFQDQMNAIWRSPGIARGPGSADDDPSAPSHPA